MNDIPTPAFPLAGDEPGPDAQVDSLLYTRYRDKLPLPSTWNDTLSRQLSHRSVRAYLPDPLPADTLEILLAAAQSASTSSNLQNWSVIAVEDPARKSRLAGFAGNQKHVEQAPLFLVWLADLNRLTQLAKARSEPCDGLSYLECFLLGVVDAALAAQNAVIALESLGLGAVYIGALRNKPLEVAAELALPPNVFAVFGLAIGWPDPEKPASVKPRLPQEAVLFREQYVYGEAQRRAIAAYDERARSFQREQGMPEQDWSAQSGNRVRDAKALNGRDVLHDVLQKLGFGLR